MKISVGIRTCSKVFNYWNSDRIINDNKSTIILTCINSILNSCKKSQYEYVFSIHDDNSDNYTLHNINKLFKFYNYEYEVFNCENLGNFKSQYDWFKKQNSDYFYCVEDDFLHLDSAFSDIVEMINKMKLFDPADYAVYPFNCRHRYDTLFAIYPSLIFIGPNQYWRSIYHSSHTFFISNKNFNENDDVMKFQAYNWPDDNAMEDHTINKIWQTNKVRLLCPLDSLAIHLSDKSQEVPFFDYKNLWQNTLAQTLSIIN